MRWLGAVVLAGMLAGPAMADDDGSYGTSGLYSMPLPPPPPPPNYESGYIIPPPPPSYPSTIVCITNPNGITWCQ